MTATTKEIWHLAVCLNCTKVLPQPFTVSAERDTWADTHAEATGHDVRRLTEVRAGRDLPEVQNGPRPVRAGA